MDIARALGGFKKETDYYENDQYVVSSAIGHLLEICPPKGVEPAKGKWSLANLPVIPTEFDLQPQASSLARLKVLVRLIKRKDIDGIINACDAGREGELIFRHIIRYSKTKLPLQRLWLQSMTPFAIRDGFSHLRTNNEMLPLADAALCRSEADWLVGINGTRAMTAYNSKGGGFQKTTVGRVQTPTLTLIVRREEEIRAFQPTDYFELHATFSCNAGTYQGVWFAPKTAPKEKISDNIPVAERKTERIWNRQTAEEIKNQCVNKPGKVTEESKLQTSLSPLLYDLTSLQREANKLFGFSAKRTLQLAQALYEKHKMLTYPRTDSRALPEDYIGTVQSTLKSLEGVAQFAPFAGKILQQNWIRPNKRIFNNAKISDHFAIIPTGQIKSLENDEAKLYALVTKRFLAVFYPAAEFRVTTRITKVEQHTFKTEGKVMVAPGWNEVYGKQANSDLPSIVPVTVGETVHTDAVDIKKCTTRPPARFTEATLLGAMETAGKYVEDDELREAMAEKGLGTPATRAAIIEGLISEGYMQRGEKNVLVPSPKAFDLMTLLNGLKLPELCSPELTGDWEFKLKQIELGRMERSQFMEEIREITSSIIEKVRGFSQEIEVNFGAIEAHCPECGGEITEEYRTYHCPTCNFTLWKNLAGRRMMPEEISKLINNHKIDTLDGFVSKMGRPFRAGLNLVKKEGKWAIEFDFGESDQENGGQKQVLKDLDLSSMSPLGKCPICQSNVYETEDAYFCEQHAQGVGKKKCVFRMGRTILHQEITHDQLKKILNEGKSDLLCDFVSERTKKKFSAFLVTNPKKGVVFEFEKRSTTAKSAPKTPKKATAKTPQSEEY